MTQRETDVLVVGSGAAGLSVAISARRRGLDVVVVEKEAYLGGTSAISGGWLWAPGNKQGVHEGDTRESAETYIRDLAGEAYDAAAVGRFLDGVPEALQFFENETDVEFVYPEAAPDYRMTAPGARRSGRALTVQRADGRTLGPDRLRVQPYLHAYTVFGYMPEVGRELATFLKVNRSIRSFGYVARVLTRTWIESLLRRRSFVRTNGSALMTRLISTARALDIPMLTARGVVGLTESQGAVTGVRLSGEEHEPIRAGVAVVLAAGGFGDNADLRRKVFGHDPYGINHVTATIGHGGDSYLLAAERGGVLDTRPHQPAAWGPVTPFRNLRRQRRYFPHLRAFGLPGLIAVNRHGLRFANESLSYHDFGIEMARDNDGEADTFAFVVADRTAMRRYGIGYAKPWPLPTWYYKKIGYLIEANSLGDLAAKIGVPAAALRQTVAEFNAGAVRGEDPKYDRGSNWFHHFKGDTEHRPNPNLAPLEHAPYYAVRVQMGDLGTYAGLAVDTGSQVLDEEARPIPGLYAVGSAAASIFGGGYPGYGAVLGPAMVLGYLLGRDLSLQHSPQEPVPDRQTSAPSPQSQEPRP